MPDDIKIIDADLANPDHQRAILTMLDAYMRDPMGGNTPMPETTRRDLISGLRAHPACYVFLAYSYNTPVGFSTCFLGFSTFQARPLINIHDIFVDASVRGKGVGRLLLAKIETKARELNCCRLTLEVRKDNEVARGLYRKAGFAHVQVGPNQIPMEFWRKPLD
jgi:ribosomal protein S18 acetylase RimI-like enzyme